MLEQTIKAYLYQQYINDDNLQAFVTAYNTMSQEIYDWMRNANLPIFIGNYNSGDQLKWIAKGIYGQDPPIIVTSKSVTYGPYNMLTFNQLPVNGRKTVRTTQQVTTSDDIFKRIMTWNFYKGDGFHFTVPWLKRRVLRFLAGKNGLDILNDQQWNISVTFDGSGGITINVRSYYTTVTDSSAFGELGYDDQAFGEIDTEVSQVKDLQYATVFKQAFDNGLLHMPFWGAVTVIVQDN
ncbi:protein of unknown function DUF2612 [Pantoea phage PdC23]|uniref:Uncharacterized protein n=1 Tax=Pantoea phage PdC23 TaxID=2894356 RepID=A0AAE8YHG9_9CAUD|nr:protein of unknown function DUF2612 [Pantoea phage PdC23]UGC97735.1 protein of unknown function DUF2612 [Pantoea phage PdC23]